MIDFIPVSADDRKLYEQYLWKNAHRGCELSFANVFLWGQQSLAIVCDCLVLLSHFGRFTCYSFPLGKGDRLSAIKMIIEDSKERQVPCCINGLMPEDKLFLEKNFPDLFEYRTNIGSYDYIYSIDALSELSGKKYHSKRNFINRFKQEYPDYTALPINENNCREVKQMAENWFNERECQRPDSDFAMERIAIERLFENYEALGAEGLVLKNGEDILAFTVGSRFYTDTFDVHFEKAVWGFDGAYAVINNEFAKYIGQKYPEIRFLDREEDMGLEGLRKAKQSYRPLFQVEKWVATLKEDVIGN